jgi:proline iminopeptidase
MSRILRSIAPGLALVIVLLCPLKGAQEVNPALKASESSINIGAASLYTRATGQGRPVIVLHGGPDFDQSYLLPDLDRLADTFRLIYYDQRGRGKSAKNIRPQDVTLKSDIADLDRVREHFRLQAPVLLGHSWGSVLALEYTLRHPKQVSYLILVNPAPVSASDLAVMRKAYLNALGADMERQRQILAGAAYQSGDPEEVTARYRIHFKHALARSEDYEKLMAAMKRAFISQGADGIVKARAVEDQLMRDTWQSPGYNLIPKLRSLKIPALVITGEHDFIPPEIAEHIAKALPNARLVILKDCGHFSYMECPDQVRNAIDNFFQPKR